MKKIIVVLISILCFSYTYAEEIKIGSVEYLDAKYADLSYTNSDSFDFKYDTEKDMYYIKTTTWIDAGWIHITPEQLTNLRNSLAKAKDWCKIAIDNESEITKEIPNSQLSSKVIWSFGDDWHTSYNKIQITFTFMSLKSDYGNIICCLGIQSSKIDASDNEFITYSLPQMLISEDSLDNFIYVISESNISSVLDKYNKSKEAESLFN